MTDSSDYIMLIGQNIICPIFFQEIVNTLSIMIIIYYFLYYNQHYILQDNYFIFFWKYTPAICAKITFLYCNNQILFLFLI